MDCVACGSAAATERPERTAQGYRWFRCRDCGKQYNERSGGLLNHAQYPSDVIALVVLWRLRYRLTLRDLAEMFLQRGLVFSHEAVRAWEAKLAPLLADELRQRRHGKGGARGRHWHVDETYLKVRGRWCYRFCCKVWRRLQAACEVARVRSHHAAISNSSAMKLAWALVSRPPMFRSCPF